MKLHVLGLSLLLGAALCGQQPVLPALESALQETMAGTGAGSGLAAVRGDRLFHVSTRNGVHVDRKLPAGNASSWLATVVILRLVEQGVLDLDVSVGEYLWAFRRADKKTITLRQCLASTAGFTQAIAAPRRGDLEAFAAVAADTGLRNSPGMEFSHSEVGIQVAACAAVAATNKCWHVLFRELVGEPLGLESTAFGAQDPLGEQAGTTTLPWVASGATTTLTDLGRFAAMLAGKGTWEGHKVLAPESVNMMFRDESLRHVVRLEGVRGDVRYGLCTWLSGGRAFVTPDAGKSGVTLWIRTDAPLGGVFYATDRTQNPVARLDRMDKAVLRAGTTPPVAGTTETIKIESGGRTRSYALHLPPKREGGDPLPLVVVLHDAGSNASDVELQSGFSELADRERFVVAYPNGVSPSRDRNGAWNSGGMPVYAERENVNDVKFVLDLVNDVAKRTPLDAMRVHAVGHGNGGMMVHRLARSAPGAFAGIAVVSGAMNYRKEDSAVPLTTMIVHGTGDAFVPHEGGVPRESLGGVRNRVDASVAAATTYYVGRNQLADSPATEQLERMTVETWNRSGNGEESSTPLRVVTLQGGGHAWPGTGEALSGTDTVFPWLAAPAIWSFLGKARQPLPYTAPTR